MTSRHVTLVQWSLLLSSPLMLPIGHGMTKMVELLQRITEAVCCLPILSPTVILQHWLKIINERIPTATIESCLRQWHGNRSSTMLCSCCSCVFSTTPAMNQQHPQGQSNRPHVGSLPERPEACSHCLPEPACKIFNLSSRARR